MNIIYLTTVNDKKFDAWRIRMKNKLKGFECWIISSNVSALKSVGLKPSRKMRLFNGDLECSFRRYSIYEGSKKGKYIEQ